MGGKCTGTCSVEGCGKRVLARTWCSMHYYRWTHHGDLGPAGDTRQAICSIEECERKHKGHGYCGAHLRQFRKFGDPTFQGQSGRPLKGEFPGWGAVHRRIARVRGKASRFECVDCGRQAREWSYNGADPDQLEDLTNGFLLAYSLDLNNYDPRCVSCHRKFDNSLRKTSLGRVSARIVQDDAPEFMVKPSATIQYTPGQPPKFVVTITELHDTRGREISS